MLRRILLVFLAFLLALGCCSCSGNNSNDSESDTDFESDSDEITADKIILSGDTRYRIVYANNASKTPAQKIYSRLKALDKNATTDDYYVLTTDKTPDNNTPEILVGLTNRDASAKAKAALPTYLDFSITVTKNKIIIFANTEARLYDAVKYFVGELVKTEDGVIYYPTTMSYLDTYTKYEFPSLKIGNAGIENFSIIIPAKATNPEKAAATELQLWIAEKTGKLISIKTDATAATANEIIIGKANRSECSIYTDAYTKEVHCSAKLSGTKLLIYGTTESSYSSAISAFKEKATALKGNIKELDERKASSLMNGKKAIFIGNSFIYYGYCVNYIGNDESNEAKRIKGGDQGYFYQVCKANGATLDVYNYTYGGKDLEWIYTNRLQKLSKTFFDSIDYVFISEAGQNKSSFTTSVNKIVKLFPNAQEFTYLVHEFSVRTNASHILNALSKFKSEGINVVAWGKLVYDVYKGTAKVPGATLKYNKNSFINNLSGDQHHQNPLAGYIMAQMCFSVISDIPCEGQKYNFCWDTSISSSFNLDNYLKKYYASGQTSNFITIFKTPADMLGLQKLMDTYIKKYN